MVEAMKNYFPSNVKFTIPKGGMFTWVTLEEGKDVLTLFDKAIAQKVAFVPGHPFYVNPQNVNTLRLNYTNADAQTIDVGIKRLSEALKEAYASAPSDITILHTLYLNNTALK